MKRRREHAPLPPSQEWAFVLRWLRPAPPAGEEAAGLLGEEADWEFLFRALPRHGVLSLLHHRLKAAGAEHLPAGIRERLRDYYLRNARRNMVLCAELGRLVDLLQAEGVPVIPFKGPLLAVIAHGDPTLREFGDLDLLIHPEDALGARAALERTGYRLKEALSPFEADAVIGSYYTYELERPDIGLDLELHWGLSEGVFPFPVTLAELWEHRTEVECLGRTYAHVAAEDLLPYLCAHGSKHCWERLECVVDLAAVLARAEPDWDALLHRIKGRGGVRMVLLGLLLARELLGSELPERVNQEIDTRPGLYDLLDRAAPRLFSETDAPLPPQQVHAFRLGALDDLRSRLRYAGYFALRPLRLHVVRPVVRFVKRAISPAADPASWSLRRPRP
jgi:hypothetical protein